MSLRRILCVSVMGAVMLGGIGVRGEEPDVKDIKELIRAVGEKKGPATKPAKPRPQATVTPEVQAVLDEISAAYGKLKSLKMSGRITMKVDGENTQGNHESTFTSSFKAPNLFRQEGQDQLLLGSTGKKVYAYSSFTNLYTQADARPERAAFNDYPAEHRQVLPVQNMSLAMVLSKDAAVELKESASEITLVPDAKINEQAVSALRLQLVNDKAEKTGDVMTMYLDPQTHLAKRIEIDMKGTFTRMKRDDVKSALYTVEYTEVVADAELTNEQFAWKPPIGSRDYVAAKAQATDLMGDSGSEPAMALAGKQAPDFTLTSLEGRELSLSDLKGSVVVLDFWATWCGPCVAALPHLDKIYADYQEKGLKMYAVNQRESKEKVAAFVENKALKIPVLMDTNAAVGKSYKVSGIPQTVIIGKDGVVRKVYIGFNPQGDEAMRKVIEEALAQE